MSPLAELSRAACRILSATDRQIEQIEKWLRTESAPDLIAGHTEELRRLRSERAEVEKVARLYGGIGV